MSSDSRMALARAFLEVEGCHPDGPAFTTHSSLLWPVRRGNTAMMLKVVDPDDDEAHAPEVLRYYDGDGAIRVVSSDGPIQLLERIALDPAVPTLEQQVFDGSDDEATHRLCDVIDRLHRPRDGAVPPHLIPFRSRSDTLREVLGLRDLSPRHRRWLRFGSDALDTLQSVGPPAVLHGDLHHGNVLWCPERGWLAIDPKGLWGPRVYDYANLLCNPYGHAVVADPARMSRQASIVGERAGLALQEVLRFVHGHAMHCVAWSWDEPDRSYWVAAAQTAARLAGLRPPESP